MCQVLDFDRLLLNTPCVWCSSLPKRDQTVLVLSVDCDDLLYAQMTFDES